MIIFLLVLAVIFIGIPLLVTLLIERIMSSPARREGKEALETLRNNDCIMEKVLAKMDLVAEETFEMYDEYMYNKENDKGNAIRLLSNFGRQNKLAADMNYNVIARWNPRYKFVKEVQTNFIESRDIYEKINHFRTTNDAMQKTTFLSMFFAYLHESAIKAGKASLVITGGMAILTAGMIGTMHRAGKDIGYSPKSNARYQNPDTGDLFDKDGNRVPF